MSSQDRPKGTWRVRVGCSVCAQPPKSKLDQMLVGGTLVPDWVDPKALRDWIKSGHVELVGNMNPAPGDADRSQKFADPRPALDAPGVENKTFDLEMDETQQQEALKVLPTADDQPASASSEKDLEALRLQGEEAEKEKQRQSEEEQKALEEEARRKAEEEAAAASAEEEPEIAPDQPAEGEEPTGPPQVINGRFEIPAEQLQDKNLEELNAMVAERLNEQEAADFEPYETPEEAISHLGKDLKK